MGSDQEHQRTEDKKGRLQRVRVWPAGRVQRPSQEVGVGREDEVPSLSHGGVPHGV